MTSWMPFERFRFVQFMWHLPFEKTDSTTVFDIFRRVIMWTICEHLRLYNEQFFPSLTYFCYTRGNPCLFLKMKTFSKWSQKWNVVGLCCTQYSQRHVQDACKSSKMGKFATKDNYFCKALHRGAGYAFGTDGVSWTWNGIKYSRMDQVKLVEDSL